MNLRDLIKSLHEADPDFGKVSNAEPSKEFAFTIPGDLTVGQVASFSEAEGNQRITAVDDYGNPVLQIPLGETSRTLRFDFCGRTLDLPFKEDNVPIILFIDVITLLLVQKVCAHPERFDLHATREQILALPFYRFYYDSTEGWWEAIFDKPSTA